MNYYKKRINSGFTLTEIMISAFIFTLVVAIAMVFFVAILKQHRRIETTNDLAIGLQRATEQVRRVTVSSPTHIEVLDASGNIILPTGTPQSTASGPSIRIAPAQNRYFSVEGGTDLLDAATSTSGYNSTRTTLTLSTSSPQATTQELIIPGATCPSTSVTTLDTTIFATTAQPSNPQVYFAAGDIVTIPQTGFGGPRQLTIASVGTSSIRFTTELNDTSTTWALPNGTLIQNTAGPRSRFTIITTEALPLKIGDLVYYPDDSNMATYKVLAHDLVTQTTTSPVMNIYIDPSTPSSGTDANPFTYNTVTRELIVNLQCLPPGNPVSGRTTIGTRTRIRIRSTPDNI